VGINPGLYSAATGHHFARPGNRFWPALHAAGFTPRLLHPSEQRELLDAGYGITNLVNRGTATADELAPEEFVAGRKRLSEAVIACGLPHIGRGDLAWLGSALGNGNIDHEAFVDNEPAEQRVAAPGLPPGLHREHRTKGRRGHLRLSLRELRAAEQNSVLYFAKVMNRRLYRELGYATMQQYAVERLQFSRSKTGYFVQLAAALKRLPKTRALVARGDLPWTKAVEVVKVATSRTEMRWLAVAQSSGRRDLADKVRRARRQAERGSGEPTLFTARGIPGAQDTGLPVGNATTTLESASAPAGPHALSPTSSARISCRSGWPSEPSSKSSTG